MMLCSQWWWWNREKQAAQLTSVSHCVFHLIVQVATSLSLHLHLHMFKHLHIDWRLRTSRAEGGAKQQVQSEDHQFWLSWVKYLDNFQGVWSFGCLFVSYVVPKWFFIICPNLQRCDTQERMMGNLCVTFVWHICFLACTWCYNIVVSTVSATIDWRLHTPRVQKH